MQYAMVIMQTDDERQPLSEAERDFDALVRWWADLRASGKVVAAARLAPTRTARRVTWHNQAPVVTDGPYIEAKESVAGFALIEVESAAEALEIACSWPSRSGMWIEIRPTVER